jgi:hypothetical protein
MLAGENPKKQLDLYLTLQVGHFSCTYKLGSKNSLGVNFILMHKKGVTG